MFPRCLYKEALKPRLIPSLCTASEPISLAYLVVIDWSLFPSVNLPIPLLKPQHIAICLSHLLFWRPTQPRFPTFLIFCLFFLPSCSLLALYNWQQLQGQSLVILILKLYFKKSNEGKEWYVLLVWAWPIHPPGFYPASSPKSWVLQTWFLAPFLLTATVDLRTVTEPKWQNKLCSKAEVWSQVSPGLTLATTADRK